MFSQACICSQGRGGEYPIRPPPDTWDTVNKRAVRILLECFLVYLFYIRVAWYNEAIDKDQKRPLNSKTSDLDWYYIHSSTDIITLYRL